MLKNKRKYKLSSRKLTWKQGLASVAIGVLIGLTPPAIDFAVVYTQGETYMPHSKVVKFCEDLDLNTYYFSYEDKAFESANTRAIFPRDKGVKLNVYINDLTPEEKSEMQRVVDDLNAIFKVIRPENKFILEFEPSFLDKINKYNIDVYELDEDKVVSDVVGDWSSMMNGINKNGDCAFHCKIHLKRDYINYHTFMHEIFHHLGFGDAYGDKNGLNDEVNVMMSANSQIHHIRRNDVALLVAKYGDYSTPEKQEELIRFINNYEQQQPWFVEYENQINELVDAFAQKMNIDKSEIGFDLDGKTFIGETSIYFNNAKREMLTFNKASMVNEVISLNVKDYSAPHPDYLGYTINNYLNKINGVTIDDAYGIFYIYATYQNKLYKLSPTYSAEIGTLATQNDINEFEETKTLWSSADNSTLTRELADCSFPDLDEHLPNVSAQMPAGKLSLQSSKLGEIVIDKNVTIGGTTYPFEYYRGGIMVPVAMNKTYFIFPDENGKYLFIEATRIGFTNYYKTQELTITTNTQASSHENEQQ